MAFTRASLATLDTVPVQDSSRIWECSQTTRQRGFQLLVRHYISQILYGCKSAYCDTPTCLSSNTRNTSRPYRPPTQLTARALAHYLASQDHPHRALCPHELKVLPDSLEIAGRPAQQDEAGGRLAQRYRQALEQRRQAKKDHKSLAQNLFDSFTIIYSYSKQIPSPASLLSSLYPADANHDQSRSNSLSQPDTQAGSLHAKRIPHTNDGSNTPLLNGQHSRPKVKPRYTLQTNEHHLSRDAETSSTPSLDPNTLDGASDSSMMSIAQSGKKNFTIGGASLPTRLAKPQHGASERVWKDEKAIGQTVRGVPILPNLNCSLLDELKEEVYPHGKTQSTEFSYVVDYDSHRRARRTRPIVNRSLFYTLSNPETLLTAFHDANVSFMESPLPHLDSVRLANSFRDWNHRNGALVFDSLWLVLEALFTAPPELDVQKSPRLKSWRKGASTEGLAGTSGTQKGVPLYLSTREAAHIVLICIHALTSLVPIGWPHTWAQIRKLRSWGVVVPNVAPDTDAFAHPYMDIIDELEYEPALRLADRLLRAMGTRTCFEHIIASLHQATSQPTAEPPNHRESLVEVLIKHLTVAECVVLANKQKMNSNQKHEKDPGWTVTATFMEWLKTIIIKKWDGKAEINKWSSVGTAIMILDKLDTKRASLNLAPNMFEIPFFNERLNTVNDPINFLAWEEQPNTLHVLQYPCLFSAQHLVAYFRTINFTEMMKQYDHTMRTKQLAHSLDRSIMNPYWWLIEMHMRVTLSEYFVLDISRKEPLKDTLDHLWGQDRRMLLKPLKVKMGHGEGEVGLDHGGVTYEFFRIVLGEAFKPDNGMFTIDPWTQMTWFQPQSLELLWKFQMIGILFSLAVYNGITLPVTFPLAFYDLVQTGGDASLRRQVDPCSLDYIRDGWPALASGLQALLAWDEREGDVADVWMREYSFSYDVYGEIVNLDMTPRCTPDKDNNKGEPIMVTNANRHQYVRDYIRHLTHLSVAPQLEAFRTGFLTCISKQSLKLFTPSSLRHLVEGNQHISIPSLRAVTKYEDGYSATHPAILAFWTIAERFTQEECRRLLEFVTASDRVPVTGYQGIEFVVVRVAGGEEGRLPGSSTCFGKFYLPEYKGRGAAEGDGNVSVDVGVMERKIRLAIGEARGFGVV
ncbi:hypothetical protein BDW02DRAFT_571238 [Decorospora gaudefroyi]|uniref:HECT-type E3 ubiquitin transferase n=1 Tax=Decorospora gaudefroyi TaxID=184978 RepID=A0A6A5K4T6_9PLEO|nr:hypothetical protein BDW02DRAFT_571238 [Decorospora gaudefroyi]